MTEEQRRAAVERLTTYCALVPECLEGCKLHDICFKGQIDRGFEEMEDEFLERCLAILYADKDQTAKSDAGKPKLTLVPRQIIFDIAKIREYGNNKYPEGGPDNWKSVDSQRYRDAAFRHFMAYLDDPKGVDEESGLLHLSHLACNVAFLCELEKGERDVHDER